MMLEFIRRYFRERRAYWNVIRELSTYSVANCTIWHRPRDIEHIAREARRG